MQPSQLDKFINTFSKYIENGDAQGLAPYLTEGSNPNFLKIYRNGVLKACLDALSSNFPTLSSYLGTEQFKDLSRDYVLQHWPTDTRLSNYGHRFADFIDNKSLPFSQDFARLDRAWLDALFAHDEPALQHEDVTEILTQENQQDLFSLQLADSVKLVTLDNDCITHWLALKFTLDTETQSGAKNVLFWRHQQKVQYRVLDEFEDSFIRSMRQTSSVLSSAETTIASHPDEDIGAFFGALLTAGVLVKPSNTKKGI